MIYVFGGMLSLTHSNFLPYPTDPPLNKKHLTMAYLDVSAVSAPPLAAPAV